LIVDIDVHFSGGTAELIEGHEEILLVDVFGARGQEVKTFARKQGRQYGSISSNFLFFYLTILPSNIVSSRWEWKEVMGNTIAINVALLDDHAGTLHPYVHVDLMGCDSTD